MSKSRPQNILPKNPSLEQFRKLAKDLHKSLKAGDGDAVVRLREFHPAFVDAIDEQVNLSELNLRDAQLVVAREYHFENWADPTVDQLFAFDDERLQIWYASGEFFWIVLKTNDVEVLDRFVEHFGNEQIKTMSIQKHWFLPPSITFLNRLVEHGLNVNQRDWRGRSFIFSAGDDEWLQRYIELGADLNVVEFMECSTRLGYAAFHNNLEMARLLLENGADPNLPTEHEWARPLAQAESKGHTEMVTLLKAAVD